MSSSDWRRDRPVAVWLLTVAAMTFVMVVIGGATRLTESGLSIVEWAPLLGWIPPMSEAAWIELFEKYKAYPQYREVFPDLDLDGFKGIFWLEYIHRVWGRLMGIAYAVPLVWFLLRRRLPPGLLPHLIALLVVGAAQGVLGWLMVASGLVDRPSVSHYRLAAHLGLAIVIYVYLLWLGLGLLQPRRAGRTVATGSPALVVYALLTLTIVVGAFVAGLNAGRIYNTFPAMGAGLVPPDYWLPGLGLLNLVENPAAVQFNHRLLALLTVFAVCLLAMAAVNGPASPAVKRAAGFMAAAVLAQFGLGIMTLLAYVPVSLGTLHQAGAVVVVTAVLWFIHVNRRATRLMPIRG